MKRNRIRAQRALGAGVVGVVLTAGLALTPAAHAAEEVTSTRVAGRDRFETAVAVADVAYPSGTDTVILSSGRAFPDALAGAALASVLGAPVLLTEPDQLPTVTGKAIEELGAQDVVILGGHAAVSEDVEDDLPAGSTATRIAGTDRYKTAAAIAAAIGAEDVDDLNGRRTAIIATGRDFADALAGGPLAATGAGGAGVHPILLVDDGVPAATAETLTDLDIEQVVILGGTGAVSSATEQELEELTGSPAVRLAGGDRFSTAVAIAEAALADFGHDGMQVLLANGRTFADALAGGPLGALHGGPIVLTEATRLPSTTEGFFRDNSSTIEEITTLGGTAAVADAVQSAAEAAAEAVDANPEAPAGAFNVVVQSVDKTAHVFVGCATGNGGNAASGDQAIGGSEPAQGETVCDRFEYDDNDSYSIGGSQLGSGMSSFESAISPSDKVSGSYQQATAEASSFNLTDSDPVAPESASAAAPATGGATVSFKESSTPTADAYRIYRAAAVAGPNDTVAGCPDYNNSTGRGSYSLVGTHPDPTPTSADGATLSYHDATTAGSTSYCYAVSAVDDGDESNSGRAAAGPGAGGSVKTAVDDTPPESVDATVRDDEPFIGRADTNDVWRIGFDEPVILNTSDSNASTIGVRDGDSHTATVRCIPEGASATRTAENEAECWLNIAPVTVATTTTETVYPPGTLLKVKLAERLDPDGDDLLAEMNYPMEIVSSTIVDRSGNRWTPSDDPDGLLENQGDTSGATESSSLDADVDDGGKGTNFATILFTDSIDPETFDCKEDVVLRRASDTDLVVPCDSSELSLDGRSAIVRFPGAGLQTGDMIEVRVNSVVSKHDPERVGPPDNSRTRIDFVGT